ncbi:hypothetical protein BSKO_08330 [Bryopsis sp. KO-2023]|nr:hypothetical protein BSKO_08330 [Bryopsis sp. KO-2023]
MEGLRDVGFVSSLSGLRGGFRTIAPSSQTYMAAWEEGYKMSPTSLQSLSPGSLRGTSQFIGVEENLQDIMSTPWHSSPSNSPEAVGFEDSPTISQTRRPYSAATSPKKLTAMFSPHPASQLAYLNLAEASHGGLAAPETYQQRTPLHSPPQHVQTPWNPRPQSARPINTNSGAPPGGFIVEEDGEAEMGGAPKVVHSPIPPRPANEDYENRNIVAGDPVDESWDLVERGGDSTALRTELARLNAQYKDAQEAIEKAHQQVEEQSLHSAKLQRRIKVLEGEAEIQNDKLLKAEQAALDYQESLSKREADFKTQGNHLHITRQQNEALERDARMIQEEIEKERMKCQVLEDKLSNAKDEMVALQKEISQEHRKQQTWSADERKMNAVMESCRKDNQRLEEALEKKELEAASLKENLKGAHRDAEGVSKILQQVQFENATLARENTSQKRTIAELEALVSKLEDTIAISREEMAELKYRCRELEGSAFKMVPETYNPHHFQHPHRQRPSQPRTSRKSFPWQQEFDEPPAPHELNPHYHPQEQFPPAVAGMGNFSTRAPAYNLPSRHEERDAATGQLGRGVQFDLPPQSGYSRDQGKLGFSDEDVREERERERSDMFSNVRESNSYSRSHEQEASPNHNLSSSNEYTREEHMDKPSIGEAKHPMTTARHVSPIVVSEWGEMDPTSDWQPRGKKTQQRKGRTSFERSVKESMRRTKILEDHLVQLGLEKKQLECEYVKMPPYGGRTLNAITRKQLVEGRLEEIGREISQIRLELKMLASSK